MSQRKRDQNKAKRKLAAKAHFKVWCLKHPEPYYGCGDPAMWYWALRDIAGKIVTLAIAPSYSSLHWTIHGITPSWTVDNISGWQFDVCRHNGVPVVDGVTLEPVTNLRPPNLDFIR